MSIIRPVKGYRIWKTEGFKKLSFNSLNICFCKQTRELLVNVNSLAAWGLVKVEQQSNLMEPRGRKNLLDLEVLPQWPDRQITDLQLDIGGMLCEGQLGHKKAE